VASFVTEDDAAQRVAILPVHENLGDLDGEGMERGERPPDHRTRGDYHR